MYTSRFSYVLARKDHEREEHDVTLQITERKYHASREKFETEEAEGL